MHLPHSWSGLLATLSGKIRQWYHILRNTHARKVHIAYSAGLFAFLFGIAGLYATFVDAPRAFPIQHVISIPEGTTIKKTAYLFEKEGAVSSAFLFEMVIRAIGSKQGVIAGDYFFKEPKSVFALARAVATGDYGLLPQKITVTEGSTIFDIAERLDATFTDFDKDTFIALAENYEGYLFPDTYFFLPNVTPEQVIEAMEANFYVQLAPIQEKIANFGRPLHEVVIMASLLEKEARRMRTRRMISGILWNRLDIDMLLQVDATFLYINGKNTYELSKTDLKEDSPYNTYKYKGLPKGPIANPGLSSLEAAVTPITSNYLFYLADRSGNTYYSPTFEQHKQYKAMYVY